MLVSEFATGFKRPDRRQHPVERREVVGVDLGDEVPAAVGRVDAPDLGHPPERRHHRPRVGRAHLDRHDRPHRRLGGAREPHGEAEQHAARPPAGRCGSAPCRATPRAAAPAPRSAGARRRAAARSAAGRGRRAPASDVPPAFSGDVRPIAFHFDRLLAVRQPLPPLSSGAVPSPSWSSRLLDALRDRPDDRHPQPATSRCSASASSSAPPRAARRWGRRRCAPPGSSAPSPTSATGSPTAARSTRSRPSRSPWSRGYARRCRHLAEIAGWTRAIHDRAYAMAAEPGVPIFLGGDHAISMGTITGVARARAEQGRELAVLWLDAHADYNTPETTPSRQHARHGAGLRRRRPDPRADPRRPAAPRRSRPPTSRSSAPARSIPRRRRGCARTASTPSTCARSTSAASRRCSPSGSPAGRRAASTCTSASTSTSSTRRSRRAPAPSCPAAPPTARRTW